MKRLSGLINQFEGGDIIPEYSDEISLSHVDLKTPDNHKLLLKDISINLQRGKNVLIKGASGLGKTSIFRLLSSLWKPDAGVVRFRIPIELIFYHNDHICHLELSDSNYYILRLNKCNR